MIPFFSIKEIEYRLPQRRDILSELSFSDTGKEPVEIMTYRTFPDPPSALSFYSKAIELFGLGSDGKNSFIHLKDGTSDFAVLSDTIYVRMGDQETIDKLNKIDVTEIFTIHQFTFIKSGMEDHEVQRFKTIMRGGGITVYDDLEVLTKGYDSESVVLTDQGIYVGDGYKPEVEAALELIQKDRDASINNPYFAGKTVGYLIGFWSKEPYRGSANNWKNLMSSKDEAWRTPDHVYDYFDRLYHFNFDAAASPENARTKEYFTKKDNALRKSWSKRGKKRSIWLNPPYSRNLYPWIEKAYKESCKSGVSLVGVLVFARTDTKWWHDFVIPHAWKIHFIQPRLRFLDSKTGKKKGAATAPSVFIVFKGDKSSRPKVSGDEIR
jgi:phage N-6-adenine-methyltransferase